jgi:NAD(P)-dependent dehydrogenase (short-subunit alcohol dehydrogenase family)
MDDVNPGRRVLITGANSGIGRAAAIKFASEGWQVIMACRNLERGRRAREGIIASSGSAAVQLMQLDVASFESVRSFCSSFEAEYDRLDVLIHNAGYLNHGLRTYQRSPDGLELTFATNVFGPLLLTELLLEPLARSNDARVLFAASTNLKHFFDPKRAIEFDNLRGEHAGSRPYSVYKMYGDSKMGGLLLAYRMAQEYRSRAIKVNAVMIPQVRISRESLQRMTGLYRVLGPLVQNWNPFALTPERMASTYFHITASPEFREVTGALVDVWHRVLPPARSPRLSPFSLLRELLATRHAPAYANPDNVERMWRLGQEVIGGSAAAIGAPPADGTRPPS